MRKNDFKLIGILFLVAVICLIAIQLINKTGGKVIVTVDGKEYGTYKLTEDATIKIESEYGTNTLVIKDQKAKMEEANCPDKLCVHQKAIDKTGETIVCLPHKVVITVIDAKENELDVIAQ